MQRRPAFPTPSISRRVVLQNSGASRREIAKPRRRTAWLFEKCGCLKSEDARCEAPRGACGGERCLDGHTYPDRRLLVFCVTLPCPACSRRFCFSSSRWPLVVSTGIRGVLPGPLWLQLSSGTGLMVFGFVIIRLRA